MSSFALKAKEWNKAVFGNIFYRKKRILVWLGGVEKALNTRSFRHLK